MKLGVTVSQSNEPFRKVDALEQHTRVPVVEGLADLIAKHKAEKEQRHQEEPNQQDDDVDEIIVQTFDKNKAITITQAYDESNGVGTEGSDFPVSVLPQKDETEFMEVIEEIPNELITASDNQYVQQDEDAVDDEDSQDIGNLNAHDYFASQPDLSDENITPNPQAGRFLTRQSADDVVEKNHEADINNTHTDDADMGIPAPQTLNQYQNSNMQATVKEDETMMTHMTQNENPEMVQTDIDDNSFDTIGFEIGHQTMDKYVDVNGDGVPTKIKTSVPSFMVYSSLLPTWGLRMVASSRHPDMSERPSAILIGESKHVHYDETGKARREILRDNKNKELACQFYNSTTFLTTQFELSYLSILIPLNYCFGDMESMLKTLKDATGSEKWNEPVGNYTYNELVEGLVKMYGLDNIQMIKAQRLVATEGKYKGMRLRDIFDTEDGIQTFFNEHPKCEPLGRKDHTLFKYMLPYEPVNDVDNSVINKHLEWDIVIIDELPYLKLIVKS